MASVVVPNNGLGSGHRNLLDTDRNAEKKTSEVYFHHCYLNFNLLVTLTQAANFSVHPMCRWFIWAADMDYLKLNSTQTVVKCKLLCRHINLYLFVYMLY